ncbi:MAG: hypothetical protein EOS24_23775 [Mesorhizobium sp.]|uniref:hypothetical protein n=1 Tax=Mesorhizobium sp. TaxID=1871066 RepID=UPI000FE73D6F|nr:hypothetical protein [Mesorhizobium sp.]RWE55177.1 MAG: hypothetical protein EOS24_23775 [Mesorhizobium sp.]
MPANDALLAAVAKLDMIDLCGRIVADPERNAVRATTAEILALAMATEGLWAIALEASLLVSALERTMPWAAEADAEHLEHVVLQMVAVRDLLAFMRPIPSPTGE